MKGINLRSLKGQLHPVDPAYLDSLIGSFQNIDAKLAFCKSYIDERYPNIPFKEYFNDLPRKLFRNFSFDEMCKLEQTTCYMHDSVRKILENRINHVVVHKIANSMWRWGYGKDAWNDVVDIYSKLQSFSFLEHPDFEIRIDLTTGDNQWGRSRYTRTFLDGVFGILVYYKHEHVMTIGFSFMKGHKILIQQIQLKKQTGNRWLYKLPNNRVEFMIEVFQKNFPGYTLFIVDGKTIAEHSLSLYQSSLGRYMENMKEYEDLVERKLIPKGSKKFYKRSYQGDKENAQELTETIQHIQEDTERLVKFYANTGKFLLGESITLHGLTHYQVVQETVQVLKKVA